MKRILLIFALFATSALKAQTTDTLKVVSYNLLNFPATSSNRIDTLKTILTHLNPDILMVCELTSSAGADDILFNALNVGGETAYEMAPFMAGPDTQNELYYNSDKLALVDQHAISTDLRDIDEYVLYHKATDIATATDTVYFYVYVCHLKAGTGFEAQRNSEAGSLKDYIATRPNRENVIIGGDFNFYGSTTEPAWSTILSGAGVSIKDPISTPGNWHSSPGFAPVHTQSTRLTSFDGGSTGGLDDRFDFLFISPDLNTFANGAKYVSNSYRAVGQDALHFNKALIDAPVNTSEPWNVITALYNMSDHLPVLMKIEVATENVGLSEMHLDADLYFNKSDKSIHYKANVSDYRGEASVYDMGGNQVKVFGVVEPGVKLDVSDLDSGIYIFRTAGNELSLKFRIDQ